MRRVFVAAASAVAIAFAQLPGDACAQSFFQSLFGSPAHQPAFQQPREPRRVLDSPYGNRTPPIRSRQRDHDDEDQRHQTFDKSGRYRTLCVRMCDGYYWPISFAARRSNFYNDANLCRSSCGEEARLFFHASRDGDTKDMVDISGHAYTKLPTAYLYRKTPVDGCKCRPEPWAQSELDRHRLYALNEAGERQATAMAVAANSAHTEKPLPGTSDKAVAAKFAQLDGPGKSAHSEKPQPAVIAAADAAPVQRAEPAAGPESGTAATPAEVIPPKPETAETPEAALAKRSKAGRSPRADRAERRQASNEPSRPRVVHAKAQAAKPSGAFGLGAGSKSMRWPGE